MRVILADDQTLLRDTLENILKKCSAIDVVATVADGQEAVMACGKYNPDIVLMDIQMPIVDGIEATKLIKTNFPHIKVLMLTTFENIENILESFASGADGYIVKDIDTQELILCIECISKGIHVIHDSVHQLMIQQFIKINNKNIISKKINVEIELSKTEIEIIKLVSYGKSNREIAQIIGFAEGTIKNKITKVFEKLDINDRTQIAVFAIEHDIILLRGMYE